MRQATFTETQIVSMLKEAAEPGRTRTPALRKVLQGGWSVSIQKVESSISV